MDIHFYLQKFESTMTSYQGDDPLEAWDKFVDFLDPRLPPEDKRYMSVVLERLVQTFLQDKRYHNDLRFINHCIQCASYHSDPVMMYSQVHGHGVGTQSAVLYTSWAQECERRNLTGQAEQVYQKALENRAEPLDMLMYHYRLFQSRTGQSQTTPSDTVNTPLQDSQLVNQQLRQTDRVQPQCNDVENCLIGEDRIIHIGLGSENNPQLNSSSETKCVSMYCVGDVACEGSELSFEELRARRYFTRIGQQKAYRQQDVVSTPLQDSRLVNQQLHQTDRVLPLCNDVGTFQISEEKITRTISRSENNPQPINNSETKCVSMYRVGDVVSEGSELSFEELRARRYFIKLRQQEVYRQQEEMRRKCEEEEQEVMRMKKLLTELNNELSDEPHPQQVQAQVTSGLHPLQSTEDAPNPTDQSESISEMSVSEPCLTHHTDVSLAQRMQHTLTLGAHTRFPSLTHMVEPRPQTVWVVQEEPLTGVDCTSHTQQQTPRSDVLVGEQLEGDTNTDVSHGGVNHSHVTPNTSLGLISATPSRALPSPTVNTREALDLIGNMFQGPTLLQDSMFNTTHINSAAENDSFERNCRVTVKAPSSTPFRVYQDENENGSVDAEVVMKPKPVAVRALMEIPVSKANVTPIGVGSITDDSTVWGNGHAPMASFPNHTQDFALSAHLVSTPLHPITPYSWNTQHSQVESGAEENPYLRQPAKLSPILEQSSPEEKQCGGAECTPSAQGTIMGECVSLQGHTHSLTQHSQTNSTISKQALAPFAPLPLTDQSIATEELRARTKPSWTVYQSPDAEIRAGRVSMVGDMNSSSLRENTPHHAKEELHLTNSNLLHMSEQFTSSTVTCLRDQVQSTSLQCHSNTELNSHAQNSYITSFHSNSNEALHPRLHPEVTNFRSMNIIEEVKPDHLHLNHSQLSDVEEADVLIPERSFNMRKSVSLLLENPYIHHQNSLMVPQSPDPVMRASQDISMSPDPILGFGWLQMKSPVQPVERDLDVVMKSPPPLQIYQPSYDVHSDQQSSSILERSGILLSKRSFSRRKSEKPLFPRLNAAEESLCFSPGRHSGQDVPMSPAAEPELRPNRVCPESLVCQTEEDLDMMLTSQRNSKICAMGNVLEISQKLHCDDDDDDDLMSPAQPSAPATSYSVLISDPWDDDLIASLLAGLCTPLTSYPNLSSWSSNVPSIAPKLTVQMGEVCVRVDCVVGQGAFATVYQATDIITAHKLVLKVQKPFNPWEFYINTQLNARVEPSARHLYSQLHAAHLFTNGSVLLGELYTCGTLLNVVNLYKSRSEKVMPQPLVLYFAVCILDMVERLHAAHIIHADIKPDNFMLGERFLENKNLSEEDLEHGLVLIDFGQSIDLTLFPKGVQFTAHCMTSGFQCTEMLSGRPWTYQTDYFGVAGTVYCMLFGSYMQVRNDGGVWKTGAVFKRNPHSALWQDFFHVLLNIPDCMSLPSLRDLRERLSSALLDNYSTKMLGLKNRLVVQILESRSTRR